MMKPDKWTIHGEIIDACNCDVICPCTVGSPATYGKCLTNVTWCIDKGHYGSVELDGSIVILAIHAPGPYFHDGNWRLAMYGDERATPEQREALETIFLGHAGGFFGEWRDFMSEIVGVRWVPIEVQRTGRKRVVRVADALDLEAEAIEGAESEAPTQLVNPPFWKGAPYPATLGRASEFRYQDFDLEWEAPGKACSFSEIHYEGGWTHYEAP